MGMAARRSTSLTLDRRLLDEARELGVNVSRAAEDGVSRAGATVAGRERGGDRGLQRLHRGARRAARRLPQVPGLKVARQFDVFRTASGTLVAVIQSTRAVDALLSGV